MIDLSALLPNFDQYPRVQYKNIILAPAKWKLDSKTLAPTKQEQSLQSQLADRAVSKYIKVGEADQTLCLNIHDHADLLLLLQILNKRKSLIIEEYVYSEHPTVTDTDGRPYTSQYLLSYTHDEQIYPNKVPIVQNENGKKRQFLPGSEWLYLELYCHPRQADRILQQYISLFFAAEKNLITEWFFIRYNEPSEHIRLRLRLIDPACAGMLLNKLTTQMENEINSGLLQDVQVRTYVRELERYDVNKIECVEKHFYLDSQFVLSLIKQPISDLHKYHLCLTFLNDVYAANIIPPAEFTAMIRHVRDGFHKEQGIQSDTFKSINKSYDKLKLELCPPLSKEQQSSYQSMLQSMLSILSNCTAEKQQELFSSLFHMHVNRLFSDNQRSHEMLIYNFIEKRLKQRIALQQTIRA